MIKIHFVSEIELCEALETSETRAKEFEADSVKLQNEIIELTLELENSRKPDETNQEVDVNIQIKCRCFWSVSNLWLCYKLVNKYLK